jgi:YidC/Oxa1 family membrane protein insertase
MSLFDVILVQPIFNILVFIYGIIPGHDFGVALILFTILIRILMWPLVKKQLHQTKLMRKLQPELQRIKKKTAGNKQLEAQLMMELYRERGVNPFSSIGMLLLQLPVFIALYGVVNLITTNNENIPKYTYDALQNIPFIKDLVANPHLFNDTLFGVVDLSKHALGGGVYWPILFLALLAAGLQFIQSKQLLPQVKDGRKLRDVLKDQASGKSVDQSEMSAIMSSRMVYLFPVLTFFISIYLAGALVLYLATTSAVAIFQQGRVLRDDTEELEDISEEKPKTKKSKQAKQKVAEAKEAEVVSPSKKSSKKRRKK